MIKAVVKVLLCMSLSAMVITAQAQHKHHRVKATPKARPVASSYTPMQQVQIRKSFYMLYLMERPGDLHNAVVRNAVLNSIARDRQIRLSNAYSQCNDARCLGKALEWTPEEIQAAGEELKRMVLTETDIAEMVQRLKTIDRYPVYDNDADTTFIRKAWQDVAAGMNHISRTYLEGLPPRYPRIDSISFRPDNPVFVQQVKAAVQQVLTAGAGGTFYRQPLLAAVKALEMNGRDEATRYEPLYSDKNAAPFAKSKQINWNAYSFSAILVPGNGPGISGNALDSMGIARCQLAAEQYRKKTAPFIIVSGGHVHPYKTPYCEAIEMKKYMVSKLSIPDSAVIIDPHARHTTTNIRNAIRLVYLFNIPPAKPLLIVTDVFQSLAIEKMALRFINELGYLPYTNLERKSTTEIIISPDLKAWQQDPEDPLDP